VGSIQFITLGKEIDGNTECGSKQGGFAFHLNYVISKSRAFVLKVLNC
jgi:hypothetical protein